MQRFGYNLSRSPLTPDLFVRGSLYDTLSDVVDACLQVPEVQADPQPPFPANPLQC